MMTLIEKLRLEIAGKKVLILGTGGTAKTAAAVCTALSADQILKVSRTPSEEDISYQQACDEHADAQIVINTTPVGMFPHTDASPLDLTRFSHLEGALDAVYNPLVTRFVQAAQKQDAKAEGGLYMLIAQAVKAYEIFNGVSLPKETLDRVYGQVLGEKQNIVLTGMPGSGKSTLGKILSKRTGRPFFDTDNEIVKAAGKRIPQIFEEDGEAHFRDLETQTIRALSARSGVIIATGGGAVLRDENIDLLKQNGRIYFRDRPLRYLLPTESRPLAASREAIEARYRERIGTYRRTADEIIFTENNLNGAAFEIERRHFGEDTGHKRTESESARTSGTGDLRK